MYRAMIYDTVIYVAYNTLYIVVHMVQTHCIYNTLNVLVLLLFSLIFLFAYLDQTIVN